MTDCVQIIFFNAAKPGVERVQVLGSKKKTQLFGIGFKIEK